LTFPVDSLSLEADYLSLIYLYITTAAPTLLFLESLGLPPYELPNLEFETLYLNLIASTFNLSLLPLNEA